MSKFGPWIGGAIGWATIGPIGAILGFAFGKMFSDLSHSVEWGPIGTPDETGQNPATRHGDFALSLIVLSAAVMKADDKIMRSELEYVKGVLKKNFGQDQAEQLTRMLQELLKQNVDAKRVAEQISTFMDGSKRLLLLQYLFGIAKADGQIHEKEVACIRQIAGWMGISAGELRSIEEMFQTGEADPYKILEIAPEATESEIKKAYRSLVVKFHPDKIQDLGPSHQKQAQERFLTIQAAYEKIKAERGMK